MAWRVGLWLLRRQVGILQPRELLLRLMHVGLVNELVDGGASAGCLWYSLSVIELIMHVTGVIQQEHVEIFLQILVGLCLTKVVDLMIEVTCGLHLDLSVTKCAPSAVEPLQERVAKEGSRVLREIHLRLLSLIQDRRCLTIGLVLGRSRRPVEVEIKRIWLILVDRIE